MASINLSSQLIASILVFYLIATLINGEDTNTTESDQSRTVSTELLSSQGAYKQNNHFFSFASFLFSFHFI